MFKVGEKVVCINAGEMNVKIFHGILIKPKVKQIKENQIYTIKNENAGNDDLSLVEIDDETYYRRERFVSLLEYRRIKLKKICSKLEIR
jgi:hypothetical protein